MTIAQTVSSALTGTAYTSSGAAVFMGWHSDDWSIFAMAVGAGVAILTYITNTCFKLWQARRK